MSEILHFDLEYWVEKADNYVTNPNVIISHEDKFGCWAVVLTFDIDSLEIGKNES